MRFYNYLHEQELQHLEEGLFDLFGNIEIIKQKFLAVKKILVQQTDQTKQMLKIFFRWMKIIINFII